MESADEIRRLDAPNIKLVRSLSSISSFAIIVEECMKSLISAGAL